MNLHLPTYSSEYARELLLICGINRLLLEPESAKFMAEMFTAPTKILDPEEEVYTFFIEDPN
jgi:hypothetical protein